MFALLLVFFTVISSLLITRVATVMLTLTGMSRESARFQARSAFSGTGFTTNEAESVVNHPVRRRIIMTLILLGSAGIVSGVAGVLFTLSAASGGGDVAMRLLVLVAGLTVVWRLAASQPVDRAMSRVIERALRRFTTLDVRDYAGLLHLSEQWMVGEIEVEPGDWLCDVPLAELALPAEGVLVLGIERVDGRWIGTPNKEARLHDGDVAIVYGKRDTLERIDARERTEEGEHDWLSSQIEFTADYLEEHKQDQDSEEESATANGKNHEPAAEPKLTAGERGDDDGSEEQQGEAG